MGGFFFFFFFFDVRLANPADQFLMTVFSSGLNTRSESGLVPADRSGGYVTVPVCPGSRR